MNAHKKTDRLRKKRQYAMQKLQIVFHSLDKRTFIFLQNWSSLIAAVLGISLCTWGIWNNDIDLVLEVLLSGAVGYIVGFLPAIVGDLSLLIIRLYHAPSIHQVFPVELLQFLGCAYIAWLGYQHHLLVYYSRQQQQLNEEHPTHVISWSAVNEVRNSLLAMRLLLFQHTRKDSEQEDFKLVEDELLRLELILGSLSKSEDTKKSPKNM